MDPVKKQRAGVKTARRHTPAAFLGEALPRESLQDVTRRANKQGGLQRVAASRTPAVPRAPR